VIANPANDCRRMHPRSEAGALVIRSLYLIKGSQGRITPDTSATSCALSLGASHKGRRRPDERY
jgi:hypothetical protein